MAKHSPLPFSSGTTPLKDNEILDRDGRVIASADWSQCDAKTDQANIALFTRSANHFNRLKALVARLAELRGQNVPASLADEAAAAVADAEAA